MKKIILILLITIVTLTGCELNNNPNSKVEDELNIVFTEDYTKCELVTSKNEIDDWIKKL